MKRRNRFFFLIFSRSLREREVNCLLIGVGFGILGELIVVLDDNRGLGLFRYFILFLIFLFGFGG